MSGPARRALLSCNPKARNGGFSLDEVRTILRAGGIEPVDPPGEAKPDEAIRALAGEVDFVILGGGDGTMNAAAESLVETGLPLAILPLGTANDLARSLGLPLDPLAAARFIPTAQLQPVDLGWVNGHYYFNVASIGFSAELAGELTSEAKKRWGVLGYAVAAVRVLRKVRPFGVTLEYDGKVERVVTIQVSVGNGRHYGGGMTVEQAASVDDGNLDFYSLEIDHWWRLLALLPALRRGTQGKAADVRAFKTQEIRLYTRKPRPINTDGELTTETPAHFKVMPKILRIYAPPASERSGSSDLGEIGSRLLGSTPRS
ncbi:lipid kinase [Methylobacterium persicinum]|uniref:YegS/Rv2252/BmrU family lipid kinase n=1 Tax=Methylobacterium persicinum TaxID=374426 RepID=A0ABU0HN81_9HYPH|nr:lipid kinase [Methylobacterium persicinum]MDQ0443779.1 YegS/Rv2252/BmrU family lipid kinase [Methylobacterium persicinum]GJE37470.1 lipid kinase YegS [Methylobacterium persicinum]